MFVLCNVLFVRCGAVYVGNTCISDYQSIPPSLAKEIRKCLYIGRKPIFSHTEFAQSLSKHMNGLIQACVSRLEPLIDRQHASV